MAKLSAKQRQIVAFIKGYASGYGRSPTVREIGRACDISSTSVVNYHLNRLAEMGELERDGAVSRGVRVAGSRTVHPGDTVHVVVDGRVVEATYVADRCAVGRSACRIGHRR